MYIIPIKFCDSNFKESRVQVAELADIPYQNTHNHDSSEMRLANAIMKSWNL